MVKCALWTADNEEHWPPAGPAMAVRDAVRPYVGQLLGLWGAASPGLDLALVALSVAFPAEAGAVTAQLHDWFDSSEKPLRTAVGLALGFHALADQAVDHNAVEAAVQPITWVTRPGVPIRFTPN